MRSYIRVLAAAALTLGVAGVVAADTDQVRAFIPFDFTVRGTTLSSGTYYVSKQFGSNDALAVSGLKKGVFILGTRVDASNPNHSPTRLIFHRYGDRYFLSQIWMANGRGFELPQSMQERELATSGSARVPMASVTIPLDKTTMAMR